MASANAAVGHVVRRARRTAPPVRRSVVMALASPALNDTRGLGESGCWSWRQ